MEESRLFSLSSLWFPSLDAWFTAQPIIPLVLGHLPSLGLQGHGKGHLLPCCGTPGRGLHAAGAREGEGGREKEEKEERASG